MDEEKFVLFSLLLFCVWELAATNYCPEASPQCRCDMTFSERALPRPYSILCESGDTFPNLTNIEILPNASTITFRDFNVTANSNFSRLREFPNFIEVRFTNLVNLSHINWNWFSDRTENVRVTSDYDVTLGTEDGCNIRSDIIIDTVQLIMRTLSQFPTCLPPRTRLIGVSSKTLDVPLSENEHFLANFHPGEDSCYDWPNETSTIRLQDFDFNRILPSMFCDQTYKINYLNLGWCRYGLHSLSNLPPTLTKLSLYDCKLENQTINLSNDIVNLLLVRVWLDRVPAGLPASLEILSFDGNNITKVHGELEHLSKLRVLNMQKNQLTEWPDRLPHNLKALHLSYNFLEYIPSNAFAGFTNLSTLIVDHNRLLSYPLNLPMTSASVSLKNNRIRTITGNYKYCNQCRVDLSDNPLICNEDLFQYISWMAEHAEKLIMNGWCRPFLASITSSEQREEVFRFIDYYAELGCEYNVDSLVCSNQNLTTAPLPSPFSLQELLDLGYNKLTELPDSIYINQTYVLKIALSHNLLREIPYGLPYEFLTHLWLRGNKITHVTPRNGDEFVRMKNLQVLDLGDNLLKMVYPYHVRGLSNLDILRMDSNPFDCVCRIFFFAMWIQDNLLEAQVGNVPNVLYMPTCATPKEFEHRTITAVITSFSYICMESSCYYEPMSDVFCLYNPDSWWPYNKLAVAGMVTNGGVFSAPIVNGSLTMTSANWTNSDFANITNLQFFNIDLSNNLLTEFPTSIFGEFTTVVDLSRNMIESLPFSNNLVNLRRLQSINFTDNSIRIIHPDSVQTLQVIPVISLEGNPLACECEQLPLMTWLESIRDRLLDEDVEMEYGGGIHAMTCAEPEMLRGRKMLDEANENFDKYCPIPVQNRLKLIISVTVPALFIVILASILLNIYLDKKRKKRESENIIRGFKQLLSKESAIDAVTSHSYKYDAFISYANKEEDFVYSLIKELEEKRKRKISFHQRDFIAGLSIVDNIVECIGNSSRVILIISDDFIRSSWCQYEVQVALANMHKRRRGKLLVPILVQGNQNEDKMRGNTKTILSEIAAITAPNQHVIDDVTVWSNFCDQVDQSLPTTPSNII